MLPVFSRSTPLMPWHPRLSRPWMALVAAGIVNHIVLSLTYPSKVWTTSAGVAPMCLLGFAACLREIRSAEPTLRWRWGLLSSALLLWASAWVALAHLQLLHADFEIVQLDSLLSGLRCVPLLLLLATIGEADEQPIFRVIDGLQGLLAAGLMTALLFPVWFSIGSEVSSDRDLLYRDGAYISMALISITGLLIDGGAERNRFARAVCILLVGYAAVGWIANHLIVPYLILPGSIKLLIVDTPFALFTLFLARSPAGSNDDAKQSAGPVDLRMIGPACFTAFLLLLTYAISERSVAVAIAGLLATIVLYVVRTTVLQTLYLRLQAEIARTARARAETLAAISHEIRAPLCGVILNAERLSQLPGVTPEQSSLARIIHLGTDAVVELLNDMLELARLDVGAVRLKARPYDAVRVARDALDLVRPQAAEIGIQLAITVSTAPLPPMIGDAGRLRQVLVNLLINAVRFTPGGGRVALTVIEMHDSGRPERRQLRMTVTDTGIGMPPEVQASLLDATVEARPPPNGSSGSGLGLMISRRLMALMDGSLEFESRQGRGSRFWIDVPVVIPRPEPMPRPSSRRRFARHSR